MTNLTRAALMEAAVKRVHATHGEQCVVGDNCPGNGVVEHAVAETIAACLPLIVGAIETERAGVEGSDANAVNQRAGLHVAFCLVHSLMGSDDG